MSPAPTTINTFDDGRYVDVNDSFLRLLGYAREELVGRRLSELRIWADPADHRTLLGKLAAQGFVRGETLHLLTKTGEQKDVLASAEIIALNEERFILSTAMTSPSSGGSNASFADPRRWRPSVRLQAVSPMISTISSAP